MIFCSRRVFLNVLTQLMDLNTLLNANYFLVDQQKPTGYASFDTPQPRLTQDGMITYDDGATLNFTDSQPTSIHNYFINYSRVLDTAPYFAITAAGVKYDFSTPEERFVHYLQSTDTQLSVYDFIFNRRLNGNGLQILIMKDDVGCEVFGHIICSYLAEVFGADVTFIDPKYRPRTKGQLQYVGNKQYAEQHIRELRDIKLQTAIQLAIDQAKYGDGMNNLMQFLSNPDLDMDGLFHIYNLLFPYSPLPPGNYTKDHLIKIITGRIMESTGKRKEISELENLGVSFYAFDQMIGQYDSQSSDEEDFSDIT